MFKILDIKKEQKEGSKCFLVDIHFSHAGEHEKDFHFGYLDEYFKSVAVLDRQKYEEWYNKLPDENEELQVDEQGIMRLNYKRVSPYDLGYCQTLDCIGGDSIEHLEDGTFRYSQYISSNYITEAAVKQLLEMKEHMESGYCRWGNYPEQVGAFRSGDPFHDFVGILEVLDRFWD